MVSPDNLSPDYQTIDPCSNFDTLVCAGFDNRYDIPADKSSYSTGTIMSENGQTTLRHILESPYPTKSEVRHQISNILTEFELNP